MELRIVRVTDHFDEACRLYGELLGWPVTREWAEGGRGRIFGYGDVGRVELMEGEPSTVDPVSGVFLSIEHGGVDALHDRLVAGGIEISQPLADQPWGHRSFGIADPSGLKVVFFQWL